MLRMFDLGDSSDSDDDRKKNQRKNPWMAEEAVKNLLIKHAEITRKEKLQNRIAWRVKDRTPPIAQIDYESKKHDVASKINRICREYCVDNALLTQWEVEMQPILKNIIYGVVDKTLEGDSDRPKRGCTIC